MAHTTSILETSIVSQGLDHILVVDDEYLIRDSLSEYLNSEGFVCETAGTGREALEKLVSQHFTLVVTDIQMPQINGLQLLEHLCRNFPDVAVIMITALDDVETAVQSMQRGACDYIIKPFNLERILSNVNKALRHRLLLLGQRRIVQDLEAPLAEEFMVKAPQRKLAAIMFTDIVGYSALTHRSEDLALVLLEEHKRLLRSIFSEYGGKEIKTMGDGFLIEFCSALEAVRCAVEMQKMLAERNTVVPAEKRIQIRIGLHVSDVMCQDNDIYGDGVNIASRIEPLAEPTGICISEDLAHQIQNKIREPIVKLGTSHLKNIQMPMDIYKIVLSSENVPSQRPVPQRFCLDKNHQSGSGAKGSRFQDR